MIFTELALFANDNRLTVLYYNIKKKLIGCDLIVNVNMTNMLRLINEWVIGLEGYRKETALIVKKVLEQNLKHKKVNLHNLYEMVEKESISKHRKEDVVKMMRVMVNTLRVTDEEKRYEERIIKEARAIRGPIEKCFVCTDKVEKRENN